MQTANQHAGPQQPRTTQDAPQPKNSNATTCDACDERDADGMDSNGRSLCRPCANRSRPLVADGGSGAQEVVDE